MTIADIDKKINDMKIRLLNVSGTECEVYSRICGYNRSTKNWNLGKAEEYRHRKNFILDQKKLDNQDLL